MSLIYFFLPHMHHHLVRHICCLGKKNSTLDLHYHGRVLWHHLYSWSEQLCPTYAHCSQDYAQSWTNGAPNTALQKVIICCWKLDRHSDDKFMMKMDIIMKLIMMTMITTITILLIFYFTVTDKVMCQILTHCLALFPPHRNIGLSN